MKKVFVNEQYFYDMTDSDKVARKIPLDMPISKIMELYENSIIQFTKEEKLIILQIKSDLKKLLTSRWGFSTDVEYNIYKFNGIENNFPHTHGNNILLPQSLFGDNGKYNNLFTIIVHEFIHVFQRNKPIETEILLNNLGYYAFTTRHDLAKTFNIRLNPDLNNIIYQGKNKEINLMVYTSDRPSTLLDTIIISINDENKVYKEVYNGTKKSYFEHPFEFMAYTLTDILIYNKQDEIFEDWLKLFN